MKLVDAPRQQHWPDVKYIQEERKFFMIWNDCRNDGLAAGTGWWESRKIDVYGRWLDDRGTPIGEEILLAEQPANQVGWKHVPIMAYSPVEKRFLIAWYDRHAAGGDTPFAGAPSDVRATLYGLPSSLTLRVVDAGGGGIPLQDALVLVMGPGMPGVGQNGVLEHGEHPRHHQHRSRLPSLSHRARWWRMWEPLRRGKP